MSLDVLTHWHKSSQGLAWSGALLAPLFWLLDAALDFFVFGESESFYAALFQLEPVELWMRLLVSFMFVSFGIYAARLLKRAERVEQALRDSNGKLEFLSKELERLTVVDPLTGIFNRRKFHQMLDVMMAMALRHRHQFALVMLDVDHFKQINDRFGHQCGDKALRAICDLIGASIRSEDQLFRLGGEEFCLLANVSDAEHAGVLAEKMRQLVESHTFPEVGRVTVSIGVANFMAGDTQDSIYARADAALYEAKQQGRNCVRRRD